MRIMLSASVILAGLALGAAAQNAAPDPLAALTPYLDESTVAAGVLDVRNVDLDALLTTLQGAGMPKAELAQFKQAARAAREAFVRAGGRSIGFVVNLEDLQGAGPLLVVPVAADGKPQALADLFTQAAGFKAKVKGTTVLLGMAPTLDRALARKAVAVPELADAFAAVASSPTRIAVTMPPALRKSVEELMPALPKELGGGPSLTLTRGMRWAAIGINLAAGKQELRALVQASNAETATALSELARRALQLAGSKETPEFRAGLEGIRPEVKGDQVRLALKARQLETVVLPLVAKVREAANRTQSTNNLKHIALAMHNYLTVYKTFPAQALYSAQNKPLLSWRVELLPFLEQAELYKQFKRDEPWDSPANKALIAKMPAVFRSPSMVEVEPGKTTYLVPTGPKLIFAGPKKTKINQITDGTANTIFIVEANDTRAVWWTQPADYAVDPKMPKAGLFRPGAPLFLAAFADGSVRAISRSVSNESLWAYFTAAASDIPGD